MLYKTFKMFCKVAIMKQSELLLLERKLFSILGQRSTASMLTFVIKELHQIGGKCNSKG